MAARQIVKTPNVCSGDARFDGTRIEIWVLEHYRRMGETDEDLMRGFPVLTLDDVLAAWSYIAANKEEIDQCLRRGSE